MICERRLSGIRLKHPPVGGTAGTRLWHISTPVPSWGTKGVGRTCCFCSRVSIRQFAHCGTPTHRKADERGLSKQAFHLLPKIRQVDQYLLEHAHDRSRILELHPEVSF